MSDGSRASERRSRRRLLGLAAGVLIGLAGCSDPDGETGGDDGDDGGGGGY